MLMNLFKSLDSNILMIKIPLISILFNIIKLNFKIKLWTIKNKLILKIFNFKIKNNFLKILFMNFYYLMFMMNIFNIFPLMISLSNQLSFIMLLILNIWLMNNILMLMNNLMILFMNLSPKNTSLKLIFLINLIEFNSMLFQIISLTMRLLINMTINHIIMSIFNLISFTLIMNPIEIIIIFIQSYIFLMLNFMNFNNMN